MPWKECHVVDQRLRFVARRLDGEKMSALCAEFGISRKTVDKIFRRYQGCGIEGLNDRNRRPHRHANQLPMAIEKRIVRLKREYPGWALRRFGSDYGGSMRLCSVHHQHGPCCPGPVWPGETPPPTARRRREPCLRARAARPRLDRAHGGNVRPLASEARAGRRGSPGWSRLRRSW